MEKSHTPSPVDRLVASGQHDLDIHPGCTRGVAMGGTGRPSSANHISCRTSTRPSTTRWPRVDNGPGRRRSSIIIHSPKGTTAVVTRVSRTSQCSRCRISTTADPLVGAVQSLNCRPSTHSSCSRSVSGLLEFAPPPPQQSMQEPCARFRAPSLDQIFISCSRWRPQVTAAQETWGPRQTHSHTNVMCCKRSAAVLFV